MTNQEIILYFYQKVFNEWDMSIVDDYMLDSYKQHSPEVRDGKEGFKGFLSMKPKVDIIKIMEENDLVCVFFRCTFENGVTMKVFDLYRLENGKLAEHWDCTMRVDNMEINNPNEHF